MRTGRWSCRPGSPDRDAENPSGFQAFIQESGTSGSDSWLTPSNKAALRQGSTRFSLVRGAGDVSRMNRSNAATIAAASAGDAESLKPITLIKGRPAMSTV